MLNLRGRSISWSWLVALTLVFAAQACDKQEASAKDDEAKAVEADENKNEQAQKEEDKEGAAAKKEGEKANEKEEKNAEAPEKAEVGKPAPDFTLTDASGNKHTLSEYEGKTVVLEWTNQDCPYVQRHYKAETMAKTREALGGKEKVVWLAIDTTNDTTKEKLKTWKKEQGFAYPVLHDEEGKVGKTYGAKTTPHMYVIDKKGVLRYRGAIDDAPKGEKEDPTNYVKQAVSALQNGDEIAKKSTEPYGCSVKYGS